MATMTKTKVVALLKEHRNERGNCRQHAERCGNRDFVGAIDHVVQRVAVGADFCIHALTDDDRVIDDNTQDEYETEQAH